MEKIKLQCFLSGDTAYEEFKKIASQFYHGRMYKFVSLLLDGEPTPDNVKFKAEFWESGENVPPPNAPLTLEELREMDGEPVWIVGGDNEDIGCRKM